MLMTYGARGISTIAELHALKLFRTAFEFDTCIIPPFHFVMWKIATDGYAKMSEITGIIGIG